MGKKVDEKRKEEEERIRRIMDQGRERNRIKGGTDSEGWEDETKNPKTGSLHVMVRFEGEGRIKKTDPLKQKEKKHSSTRRKRYARALGDDDLLIGCNTEAGR